MTKPNRLQKQKTSHKGKSPVSKKQVILPSTLNTLAYQGLFPNGLMQVTPDYFSQTYRLGDVNYQTVGLEEKGLLLKPIPI